MHPRIAPLFDNIRQVILGKDETIRMALTALLARGHVLVEDAPGLGKTMLARALANSLDAEFHRIQFTPDLLPSDVTGVSIYHPKHERFDFVNGPVFTEILLADEINRTSPRTQSSLLEAMEERQVSVEGLARKLPDLFFVIATQNPIELQGTYPLPEAQLDRFLMQLSLGYPEPEDEHAILESQVREHPLDSLQPVLAARDVVDIQNQVRETHVSSGIREYIVAIANGTRDHAEIRLGISPRGSLALMRSAQAHAFLSGETFVTPDHVKAVAVSVLSHRLIIDIHREHTGLSRNQLVETIIDRTAVPVLPQDSRTGATPAVDSGVAPDARSA